MARKRTEWIARTIDTEKRTVTFTAMKQDDGMEKPEEGRQVVFHAALASTAVRDYAEFHGWAARIGDTMAQSAGTTIDAKLDEGQKLVDHYESGAETWELRVARKPVSAEDLLKKLLESNPELLAKYAENAAAAVAARTPATE